ncbi:TPA: UDP-N-acetylglucosamine 2-epimerase (non-hydrolyzing) [Patescibacteria group bacterium]|nr:UDP-N-acetylglucosamine 2-epimerase (non-hydrolyzing) [Patescibacteria group bacterium]
MKKLKVLTVIGTRPEIIKLSLVIKKLDALPDVEHILVHTGQNFAPNMKDVFFEELGLREPDYYLDVKADTLGGQIANVIIRSEEVLKKEKPDVFLILGDTNSALSSIMAARLGIPILHMEAGNRSFDRRVPEEQNRRMIDHISTWLFPYRFYPRENLVREGINPSKIFVTGDPYIEVLNYYLPHANTNALEKLNVTKGEYFLATTHREENVEDEMALKNIANGLALVAGEYNQPVIWSLHPRTLVKVQEFGIQLPSNVKIMEAMGFMDFLTLETNARCLISDSGTVPQEGAVMCVPSVVIRTAMERPEVLEEGATILSGVNSAEDILRAVHTMLTIPTNWLNPYDNEGSPSDRMVKFIMSYKMKLY